MSEILCASGGESEASFGVGQYDGHDSRMIDLTDEILNEHQKRYYVHFKFPI